MIYPFQCICGIKEEVYRHHSDSGKVHLCPSCGQKMDRVWTVPQTQVKSYGYYDQGLGTYIKDKSSARDAINRIGDNEGREIVEVGTESPKMSKKRTSYEPTKDEMAQIGKILGE